jgi:hypothetical protein
VAWNTKPAVMSVTLCFRDDDGAESEHRLGLPLSALSAVEAWVMDYAQLVAAVSTCALYKIRVTSVFKDDGTQIAQSGSNAKRQSVFLFQTDEGQTYVISVPGLIYSRLMQVGPYAQVQLNPTDPAIAALVSALTNGIGTVRPVAPWNPTDGGASEWDWAGVPLARLITAYWGYERPGWQT